MNYNTSVHAEQINVKSNTYLVCSSKQCTQQYAKADDAQCVIEHAVVACTAAQLRLCSLPIQLQTPLGCPRTEEIA